jgi:hypothetical protein
LELRRGAWAAWADGNAAPQWRQNETYRADDNPAWERADQAGNAAWSRSHAPRAVHQGVSLDDTPVGGGGNTRTFEQLLEQELARSGGGSGAPPPPLSRFGSPCRLCPRCCGVWREGRAVQRERMGGPCACGMWWCSVVCAPTENPSATRTHRCLDAVEGVVWSLADGQARVVSVRSVSKPAAAAAATAASPRRSFLRKGTRAPQSVIPGGAPNKVEAEAEAEAEAAATTATAAAPAWYSMAAEDSFNTRSVNPLFDEEEKAQEAEQVIPLSSRVFGRTHLECCPTEPQREDDRTILI